MKKILLAILCSTVSMGFNSIQAFNASGLVANSAITLAFASAFSNVSSSEELPKIFALMAAGFLLTHPLVSSCFNSKNNLKIKVGNSFNAIVIQNNRDKNSFTKGAFNSLSSYFSFDATWRSVLFAGGIGVLGLGCKMLGNYVRDCDPSHLGDLFI